MRRGRKAFDAIDTSGNGFIEASEFMNAMEALGTKMSQELIPPQTHRNIVNLG